MTAGLVFISTSAKMKGPNKSLQNHHQNLYYPLKWIVLDKMIASILSKLMIFVFLLFVEIRTIKREKNTP